MRIPVFVLGLLLCSGAALADKQRKPISKPPPAPPIERQEDDEAYSERYPLKTELLAEPIHLTGVCKNIKIVEWRGTPISDGAAALIDSTCNSVLKNWFAFMTVDKHYSFETPIDTFPPRNLCLLPYRGNERRGLNDVEFRFLRSQRGYDGYGNPNRILGYTEKFKPYTYMMNDVLNEDGTANRQAVIVLAHELFHVLSYHYRIHDHFYDKEYDRSRRDEIFADQFTEKYYGGKGSQ